MELLTQHAALGIAISASRPEYPVMKGLFVATSTEAAVLYEPLDWKFLHLTVKVNSRSAVGHRTQ